MTSLRGVFPQPKTIPKRNFIRENKQNLQENSRRSSNLHPQTPSTAPRRSSYHPKDTNTARTPQQIITFIKEPPKTFPKAKSANSLASLSSVSDVERPCSTCASQQSTTREASIQTADPNDEEFLKDVIIRMPSIVTKLRDDIESIDLDQVSRHRRTSKTWPIDRMYRLSSNEMDNLDELLGTDSSQMDHDDRRSAQLQRLQEYFDTNSVKSVDSNLPELLKSEEFIVEHVEKMAKQRRNQFAKKRMLSEKGTEMGSSRHMTTATSQYPESEAKSLKSLGSQVRGTLPASYRKGEIPRYLREIKEKSEEIQRLESAIDVNCPPGHIGLSDEERTEALGFAHLKFKELIDELNKLPLTSQTIKIKQRKMEIERELDKLEQSIRIFSRPKVYVKLESNDDKVVEVE